MQNRSNRYSACLLAVLLAFSLCAIDVGAQARRKRRARRARVTRPVVRPVVTNPDIAPPGSEQRQTTGDERIISTADEPNPPPEETTESVQPKKGRNDMQQTLNSLSSQVDRLNDKLAHMQENDRTLIDLERLTRAEQRTESLRLQQIDVESKLADLQSKVEQIEYQLKPENIERAGGYGTVHPEEARDSRRRQLEGERSRLQSQVRILETSKQRLELALRTADAEVDALRYKIELQQAQQDTSGGTTAEPRPARRPKPE